MCVCSCENLKKVVLENRSCSSFLRLLRNKLEMLFLLENWSCSCQYGATFFVVFCLLENATYSCPEFEVYREMFFIPGIFDLL